MVPPSTWASSSSSGSSSRSSDFQCSTGTWSRRRARPRSVPSATDRASGSRTNTTSGSPPTRSTACGVTEPELLPSDYGRSGSMRSSPGSSRPHESSARSLHAYMKVGGQGRSSLRPTDYFLYFYRELRF